MSDLDDTLLSSTKTISKGNKQAIDNLVKHGIQFIPTTGRFLKGIPDELFEHPEIEYMVSSNGSQITNIKTHEIIYQQLIDFDLVLNIIELAINKAVNIILVCDDKIIIDERIYEHRDQESSSFLKRILEYGYAASDIIEAAKEHKHNIKKIDLGFEDLDFRNELYERLKAYANINVVSSHFSNIEITSAHASKGNALNFLANYLNLDTDKIFAIGDNDNDISMLQNAGFSVAMDNASEHVKSHSNAVTDHHDMDGFAKAIDKYVIV